MSDVDLGMEVQGGSYETSKDASGIDWDSYGPILDIQAGITPQYWENISQAIALAQHAFGDTEFSVCDVGAGTGNCTLEFAKSFPKAKVVHLEPSSNMNDIARQKFKNAGINGISIAEMSFQEHDWATNRYDLIICINSLFAIQPQSLTLSIIRQSLTENGLFFIVDFGRKQNAVEWAKYFISNALKREYWAPSFRALKNVNKIVKQASKGTKSQETGLYPLHTTEQFGETLKEVGFEIAELQPCYRGYADMAICRSGIKNGTCSQKVSKTNGTLFTPQT
ncbi:MAG: class I SAM-dependent methyltransferase [Pseudomonadota bacterium]